MAASDDDRLDQSPGTCAGADATETLKPSEILERAAALVEPEGAWTQETWFMGAQLETAACFCVEGAIARVAGVRPFMAYREAASELLARSIGLPAADCIADWNDAPKRTQPEVVAALRKAAELARSEGQ